MRIQSVTPMARPPTGQERSPGSGTRTRTGNDVTSAKENTEQERRISVTSSNLEAHSAATTATTTTSLATQDTVVAVTDPDDFPLGTVDLESSRSQPSMASLARRGRKFGESRKITRLVKKDGHSNVVITKASRRNRRLIRDFFTTMMDMRLRYHILLFVSGFMVSWILFAAGWLAIAYSYGDIYRVEHGNASDVSNACLVNVYDFNTALLFSIEMQATIGFGYRFIGPKCPVATVLMIAQCVLGIFIQCFITGIVFAKIARPLRRAKTVVFSESAVICVRDATYNFIFRVGDLRRTHIIGTSIRALLVRTRRTSEGELIPLCQHPLDLVTESSTIDSFVFCAWPVTVSHRITASSPLWTLSAESILADRFEVIVILEGTVQTSGSLIQIKTSYVPSEIRWGHHLVPLLTKELKDGMYEIDYSEFHRTAAVEMPDCSAEEFAGWRASHGTEPPVESAYLGSFTCPAVPYGGADHHSSLSRVRFLNLRRPGRWNRTARQVKSQGRTTAATKMQDRSRRGHGRDSQRLAEVEVVVIPDQSAIPPPTSPPPTYASLGRSEDPDSIQTGSVDDVPVLDKRSRRFRAGGGRLNRGFAGSSAT